MPDFPIIDSHVHLWDPTQLRISWLDDDPLLGRPYTLADYAKHTEQSQIEAFVYIEVDVEPAYGLLEARWIADRAREDKRLQAIVAWAPLEYGKTVYSYLDALVAIDPRIRGVRRLVQAEQDPAYCLQPAFIQGVQLLPAYDLTFDIGIRHWQLASAIQLVRQCPDTSFVLDHLGKPDIKSQQFDPWREQINRLAEFSNVVCKVSGAVTEADTQNWTAEDLAPAIHHVIAVFGEDRVMFGSDWPVVLQASSYQRWVDTLDEITASLSTTAKRKLWNENARRFYRIEQEI